MLSLVSYISWRKLPLIIAGILICTYAVVVLWYVQSIPDIGLRAAFDNKVKQFDHRYLVGESNESYIPQEEDRLVRLGADRVETWPQLLRALVDLPKKKAEEVDRLEEANEGAYYARLSGNGLFVRVEFERPTEGGSVSFSRWCAVSHLPPEELLPSILWFFLKLGLFIVGALVFWKRPTDRSATQFFLLCIVTLGAYMGGYHWSRIAANPALILVFMVCAVLLPAVLLHFYSVFPRPKGYVQRHPWRTLLAVYGVPGFFLAALVATYFRARWLGQGGSDTEEVNGALNLLLAEIYLYLGVAAFWYLASVVCLVHSYRSATDGTERNQVKWILFGSLAALVPICVTLYLAAFKQNAFGAGAATWWMFAASVCFTAAFTISITRYRLMQLDQIISSGMVYFVVSFLAAFVYFAVVFLGMIFVGRYSNSLLAQALAVSATALVLMLVLDLVRGRIKRALDHHLHREKNQLDRTLRRMAHAIEQLVDPPTLAKQLLQASAEVLGASRGAVYLRQGTPPLYRLVDALGPAPPLTELSSGCPLVEAMQVRSAVLAFGSRLAAPDPVQRQLRFLGGEVAHALAHEGQLLALLVLGPKELGPYGTDDVNLLAGFAQLTALALKSAERHRTIEGLNRELHEKIEKISEQQRRIVALQSQLTRQTASPQPPPGPPPVPAGGIVGSSPVVHQLLQLVKKVSASQSAVLIRGESGTGKELLAHALHESSPRSGKAFVKVHCAALSPGLLESELFGHVKGAFTGAHRDKVGRFELADGGTLFLDEIGDITLEVQTKLLRVLQEMIFERVGSSEPVAVDVRVIAATHQDLERLISEGRFREDLYYRLNVISLSVPPLRERPEDIPELALHFLKLHAQRCGRLVAQIDDDALALLKAYSWPGNIRQLENVIERAVVVAEGPGITTAELPLELTHAVERMTNGVPDWPNGDGRLLQVPAGIRAERAERDQHERERLVRALASARGNKAEAARALGLARSTLVSRLKKHGLS
jgi:transcriptional regulator with GAF, ATPase, and Fis domain